jgi:serine/threonine protein kinase
MVRGVRIEEMIAEGGMGRVYRGLQADLDVPVAIKIIRPDVFSSAAIGRFKDEMRLLARLEHVGIPRIKFADLLGGQPYFVMEFVVDARSIVAYAEERRLELRATLELFGKACEAVGYGHMAGVIHRDLKPGNILVDVHGQPKVIDFGIALRDSAATDFPGSKGRVVGSPAYMSPEQWQCDHSIAPDVRSDVYSLGVVLYELLTGQRPYSVSAAENAEARRASFRQATCEQPPIPPSRVLPKLPRDIEQIVLCCLAKEPERRYSNAHEMAQDISRFLAGEPVLANPPGPWRLARHLVRRHRLASASVTLAAIGLGTAIASVGYQQGRLAEARILAQKKELDQLLISVDSLPQVYRTIHQRLEELMPEDHVQAATRLRRVAELQAVIGAWSDAATALRAARKRLRIAVNTRASMPEEMSYEVLRDLVRAELQSEGATTACDSAMELADAVASKAVDDPQWLDAQGMLAVALRQAGRPEEARRIGEQITPLIAGVWGRDHRETLMAESNLAVSCRHVGEHASAYERLRDVYQRARDSLGPKDSDTLQFGHNLAIAAISNGREREAKSLLQEVWQARRTKSAVSHSRLIQTLTELCILLYKQEDAAAVVELLNDLEPSLQEIATDPEGGVHGWCKRILKIGHWAYGRVGDDDKASQLLIALQAVDEPPLIWGDAQR